MSDGQVHRLYSKCLSQWVPGVRLRITDADRSDIPVVTTSMTLVEAYHAKLHRPAWRWALSRLRPGTGNGRVLV